MKTKRAWKYLNSVKSSFIRKMVFSTILRRLLVKISPDIFDKCRVMLWVEINSFRANFIFDSLTKISSILSYIYIESNLFKSK